MRKTVFTLLILGLAASSPALDLGTAAPAKGPANKVHLPATRQGGDTIQDAIAIDLPYMDSGTTAGFAHDTDEACPYEGSDSPDVVYTFTPATDMIIAVDMIGSAYDTKVYIYDSNLTLVACNDDYYSDYTSKIEEAAVLAGEPYFLVIDGYGGEAGEYELAVGELGTIPECPIDCFNQGIVEDEPTISDDRIDLHNGGCDVDPINPPIQTLQYQLFCGKTGYYSDNGVPSRDTDWLVYSVTETGIFTFTIGVEEPTLAAILSPTECGSATVIQDYTIEPCDHQTVTLNLTPGSDIWVWIAPAAFWEGDTYEYDYMLIPEGVLAVESHSLTSIKGLFH